MKFAYLLAGMTLRRFLLQLKRHRVSLRPGHLLKILFIFQSALWSSLFAAVDKYRFRQKIDRIPVPDDPVFIIGHWRTGSTYLHQLMSLDPNLTAPSLFEVAIPDGFLSSASYYGPLMRAILPAKRPMDNVRMGFLEPQEDEYALYRLSGYSPLEHLIFPEIPSFFLKDLDSYLPVNGELENWNQAIRNYYRKLHFKHGRRIVSKNPFNSLRIPALLDLFPKARFIHIYRNPFDVIPSTIHMFDIVQRQNCLNRNGRRPALEEVVRVFDRVMNTIRSELGKLSPETYYEIGFEALEQNPLATLEGIYSHLGLPMTPEFRIKLDHEIARNKRFKKNEYDLASGEKEIIETALYQHLRHYGYQI